MPETDEALDIRDPGLTDVLGDDDALSLWEMMRRASAATEAETLAKASGLSLEWVHDCLDRLVEADLVEMMRATSRRPTTRWRVRRETIIVGYRVNDPLDEVLIQCVDELFGPRRRKQIEAHVRRVTARRGPTNAGGEAGRAISTSPRSGGSGISCRSWRGSITPRAPDSWDRRPRRSRCARTISSSSSSRFGRGCRRCRRSA
ncbi:MAG: hypothetical protein ACYTFH_09110 [Planctomycetota bacterium]|jgi:hypothetical protein